MGFLYAQCDTKQEASTVVQFPSTRGNRNACIQNQLQSLSPPSEMANIMDTECDIAHLTGRLEYMEKQCFISKINLNVHDWYTDYP